MTKNEIQQLVELFDRFVREVTKVSTIGSVVKPSPTSKSKPSAKTSITQSEARQFLEELAYANIDLTNWEENFMESMESWEGDFTERQLKSIERMMDSYSEALENTKPVLPSQQKSTVVNLDDDSPPF